MDVDEASRAAVRQAYAHFAKVVPALKIMLATYFGAIGDNLETTLALPVAGLHVDLVRAPDQLDAIVATTRRDLVVSLGVVDGRNCGAPILRRCSTNLLLWSKNWAGTVFRLLLPARCFMFRSTLS
ncbi:hypothetical protein ACVWXO_001344 [Bradyrhizobium sp. LM2.7]